jgi:hypothetical protein
LLSALAPVHRGKDIDGKDTIRTNIEWNVKKRVDSACDTVTGQEINLEQKLFTNAVIVYCTAVKDRLEIFLSLYTRYMNTFRSTAIEI